MYESDKGKWNINFILLLLEKLYLIRSVVLNIEKINSIEFTQCDQIWYMFLPDRVGWASTFPRFKDLRDSEQEGVVPQNLSSFGKKKLHIWSH